MEGTGRGQARDGTLIIGNFFGARPIQDFLPPAARNLFEKSFLDFQKLLIKFVFNIFFSSRLFACLRG